MKILTDYVSAGSCVKQALIQSYKYRDVLSIISVARVKGVGSGVGRESSDCEADLTLTKGEQKEGV